VLECCVYLNIRYYYIVYITVYYLIIKNELDSLYVGCSTSNISSTHTRAILFQIRLVFVLT